MYVADGPDPDVLKEPDDYEQILELSQEFFLKRLCVTGGVLRKPTRFNADLHKRLIRRPSTAHRGDRPPVLSRLPWGRTSGLSNPGGVSDPLPFLEASPGGVATRQTGGPSPRCHRVPPAPNIG